MEEQALSEGKDGLSQSDRLLRMLMPENVAIDGRDPAALMLRAARLAVQFNYYNTVNELDGNWQDFYLANLNILTLMIPALDFGPRVRAYDLQLSELRMAADEESFRERGKELTKGVDDLGEVLTLLLERLTAVPLPADIAVRMGDILENVRSVRRRLVAIEASTRLHETAFTRQEQTQELVPRLHDCFSDLLIQYNRVQEIADYYRRGKDWTAAEYPPHLALLITFLHLYGCVSAQLNGLTKVHLDFYYRRILGLESLPEVPDRVHLLFSLELNAGVVDLPAGEEMLADIKGLDEPLKYRLTTDITVSKTTVAALRTLFMSDRSIFMDDDPEHRLIRNAQLYQGDYPSIPADVLLKGGAAAPWPLFGEDQEELGHDQRSMSDAAIGLLVASPLFYLTEGERTIRLSFLFIPSSFQELSTYIRRFASASRKTEQAAEHELLSRVFLVEMTTADGWSSVTRYSLRLPGDNCLELCLELNPAAKPVTGYRPGVHGPELKTVLPVVRLLLNPGAPHNGLSFFRGLRIERIQLRSEVRHFRKVKLQNSIGNLAADSAFQPWGPLPVVGSYLDIRNSNIFNRYTTDVAIRLEWMDLPKDPGGFATWYAGYEAGITDDSFRAGVGALVNGNVQPLVGRQQSFPLYCRNPDDSMGGPAPVIWLKDIDMSRLAFTNAPLLGREEEEPDGFFRNGAIRIELLSPPEAYGHALFPRLFPEVAMHNARRWNKKRPLPNQPYTPRAKSVSVNYTLEYAEAFKDPREADGGLEMIHQYPWGFKRIYPGSDLRTIDFLPAVDPGGHLYIGLSHASRGEELSLLFQLEERNFHHTLHDGGSVGWSYLQDDEWVVMDAAAILSDETNGFINTGIVRVRLPSRLSLHNHTWPAGMFWLRVSLIGASDLNSRVVAVVAQAVCAERMAGAGMAGVAGMGMMATAGVAGVGMIIPPGSISKAVRKLVGLQLIAQPFSSFGGRGVEQDEDYYIRVSERLRHKRRPLTALDIEELVLEHFPSIAVVKCVGTSYKRQAVYPGVDLQVILIPKVGVEGNGANTDQPKVNLATLFAVKNYLAGFSSPFIHIEIGNPVYEKVKIACRIRFRERLNGDSRGLEGYYLKMLHEDIRRYLCPWVYSPGSEIKIGTRVYLSELQTYIRRLSYIAEVTGFSVVHFFYLKDPVDGELKGALIDSAVDTVDFIQGSVPEAVLIPADRHLIRMLTEGEYIEPEPSGIGDFLIAEELLLARRGHARQEGYDEEPASREDDDEVFHVTIGNATNKSI